MDVMKPTLINIGGRCYRKMPFEQKIEHREPPEQRSSHHDEGSKLSFVKRTLTALSIKRAGILDLYEAQLGCKKGSSSNNIAPFRYLGRFPHSTISK